MMRYAAHTSVRAEKSKAEIERLLTRYGATSFASGWQNDIAVTQFHMHERRIKFLLPLPSLSAKEFTHSKRGARDSGTAYKFWEQATRQRWRALALIVKAKLEAVESRITTFEEEFMAHIVMPDGKTVAEHALPMIAETYKTGKMKPLLAGW
jgi:hypothetical protein